MNEAALYTLKGVIMISTIGFLGGGIGYTFAWSAFITSFELFNPLLGQNALTQYANTSLYAVGGAIVAIAMFGFTSAWIAKKFLLIMYVLVLTFAFMIKAMILVVGSAVLRTSESRIRVLASVAIRRYGTVEILNNFFDEAQLKYSCCGVINGSDYADTPFLLSTTTTQQWPESCCTSNGAAGNYVDLDSCFNSTAINPEYTNAKTGCFQPLRNMIAGQVWQIALLSTIMMASELAAILFSCCVVCIPEPLSGTANAQHLSANDKRGSRGSKDLSAKIGSPRSSRANAPSSVVRNSLPGRALEAPDRNGARLPGKGKTTDNSPDKTNQRGGKPLQPVQPANAKTLQASPQQGRGTSRSLKSNEQKGQKDAQAVNLSNFKDPKILSTQPGAFGQGASKEMDGQGPTP